MAKVYKTAMGKSIDIDMIVTRNETTIAVGNQRVNARGDELGPGGKIVRTRDQIMKSYYALKTPTVTHDDMTIPTQEDTESTNVPPDNSGMTAEDMVAEDTPVVTKKTTKTSKKSV